MIRSIRFALGHTVPYVKTSREKNSQICVLSRFYNLRINPIMKFRSIVNKLTASKSLQYFYNVSNCVIRRTLCGEILKSSNAKIKDAKLLFPLAENGTK